jgi:hypothetical protein
MTMRGLPGKYNTMQDFYSVAALGAAERQAAQAELGALMDARLIWQSTGALEAGEDGVTDATHKAVASQNEAAEDIRLQLEQVVDPYSEFARMGWTDNTAAAFLAAQ